MEKLTLTAVGISRSNLRNQCSNLELKNYEVKSKKEARVNPSLEYNARYKMDEMKKDAVLNSESMATGKNILHRFTQRKFTRRDRDDHMSMFKLKRNLQMTTLPKLKEFNIRSSKDYKRLKERQEKHYKKINKLYGSDYDSDVVFDRFG